MKTRRMYRVAAPALFGAAALLGAGSAEAAINVEVDGNPVYFQSVKPAMMNGRVFLPLRKVAEALDADVSWDARTRTVHGRRGERTFALPIGSTRAFVNGSAMRLDAPARVVRGTTVVPLRFAAEALGADVAWRPAQQLVAINLNGERVAGEREFTHTVAARTIVRAELSEAVSSATARKGERISARLDEDDRSGFPEGTRFEGRITQVRKAAKNQPGVIDVAFDRAILPDGSSIAISGNLASLEGDNVERAEDGRLIAKQDASDRDEFDWKWVGVGAAGGAILGGILGNDDWVKGGLIGAIGGAAYAYLQKNKRGNSYRDVALDEGAEFGIMLNQRVAFNDVR